MKPLSVTFLELPYSPMLCMAVGPSCEIGPLAGLWFELPAWPSRLVCRTHVVFVLGFFLCNHGELWRKHKKRFAGTRWRPLVSLRCTCQERLRVLGQVALRLRHKWLLGHAMLRDLTLGYGVSVGVFQERTGKVSSLSLCLGVPSTTGKRTPLNDVLHKNHAGGLRRCRGLA